MSLSLVSRVIGIESRRGAALRRLIGMKPSAFEPSFITRESSELEA